MTRAHRKLLRKAAHSLRKKKRAIHTASCIVAGRFKKSSQLLVAGGVLAIFFGVAIVSYSGTSSLGKVAVPAPAALTPSSVGLGKGVPACASAQGPTCTSNGTASVTINWNFLSDSGQCQFVIMAPDAGIPSPYLDVPYSSGACYAGWGGCVYQELPCVGSHTFTGLQRNTSYAYWFHIHHAWNWNTDPSTDPSNTYGEKNSLTVPNCTASNYGQSCTSTANSCGQTNSGTYDVNGNCTASTPPNPGNLGQSCASSANACGQTSGGTYQCNGSCSASAPPNSSCPQPADVSSISASCNSTGNLVVFSWPAVSGANIYQIQYYSANGSCSSGWALYTDGTTCYKDIAGTSAAASVTPGQSSYAWVNAGNTNTGQWANWSTQPKTSFTCQSPTPTVTWLGSQGCVLPNNNSGCNLTAHWTASNLPPGNGLVDLQITGVPPVSYNKTFTGLPPTDPQYLVTQAGTYIFTLFTDNNGTPGTQIGTTASMAVCPFGYTLDTTNEVCVPPPLPTVAFYPSPSTIDSGQSTTLYWSSTNASSCSEEPGTSGFSTGAGSPVKGSTSTGILTTTTNYGITCTGPGGSTIGHATVTVLQPTVSISAAPTRVVSGGSTVVSWDATNVDTCSISRNGQPWPTGGSTFTANSSRQVTGNKTDTITSDTTYMITCTNNAHTATSAVSATQVVSVVPGYANF